MSERHPDKSERWCVEKVIEDMEKNPHLRTDHLRKKTVRISNPVSSFEQTEEWQHLFRREVLAVEYSTLQKLHGLTHSEETSMRLVERIAAKNPLRNAHWCVEKAIFDIERDRMA